MQTKINKIKNKKIKEESNEKFIPRFEDLDGNTISESKLSDYIDENDCIELNYEYLKNKYTDFKFNISETVYCCGISEIGELSIEGGNPLCIPGLIKILDAIITPGHTYILSTNGKNDSLIFEKALEKCKYWTMVKSFVNKNSRNTIKMWISNNE